MRVKLTLTFDSIKHVWYPQTFIGACLMVETFVFGVTKQKVNVTKENSQGEFLSVSWIIEKRD